MGLANLKSRVISNYLACILAIMCLILTCDNYDIEKDVVEYKNF